MTKWVSDLTDACDDALELLRLEAVPGTREVMGVRTILEEARDIVQHAAVAKGIRLVVVSVTDEVLVSRGRVLIIVAALLRRAIAAAPAGGRVAVTGQEIEGELVFAVYDDGTTAQDSVRVDEVAAVATRILGGRVWTERPGEGHLTLFTVPLSRDAN